jgi:hypothetical protein
MIPEGRRNQTLFRIGCAVRARGGGVEEILAAMEIINRRCLPPLDERELRAIALSASRYAPA